MSPLGLTTGDAPKSVQRLQQDIRALSEGMLRSGSPDTTAHLDALAGALREELEVIEGTRA